MWAVGRLSLLSRGLHALRPAVAPDPKPVVLLAPSLIQEEAIPPTPPVVVMAPPEVHAPVVAAPVEGAPRVVDSAPPVEVAPPVEIKARAELKEPVEVKRSVEKKAPIEVKPPVEARTPAEVKVPVTTETARVAPVPVPKPSPPPPTLTAPVADPVRHQILHERPTTSMPADVAIPLPPAPAPPSLFQRIVIRLKRFFRSLFG